MQRPPTALIFTGHFPPVAAVGVHRVVGLCRHLAEIGWRVTVVTAAPGHDAVVDDGLLEGIPDSVRVLRTGSPDIPRLAARLIKGRSASSRVATEGGGDGASEAAANVGGKPRGWRRVLVDWSSRWLHVPDSRTGWLIPAVWGAVRESRRERPDVIFSSAPFWTSHIAAGCAATILRVPFVADFRDPWCGGSFRRIPYMAHRGVNALLERLVVGRAARITCAWDGIRRHLAARYPARASSMVTIHNGFDAEGIDRAVARRPDATGLIFVHAGSFYGPRSPIPLLRAIQRISGNGQSLRGRASFLLIGANVYNGRSMEGLIQEYGVGDQVCTLGRVPHEQALGMIKGSDATMLFGQSGSEALASVPAKAYEYIGVGKPVLAIGAGEEVCELMRQGGCRVWSAPDNDSDKICAAITEMAEFLESAQREDKEARFARSKLERKHMAVALEALMRDAIRRRTVVQGKGVGSRRMLPEVPR